MNFLEFFIYYAISNLIINAVLYLVVRYQTKKASKQLEAQIAKIYNDTLPTDKKYWN